ncbi:MAG: hypothetical protein QG553_61 [Patescibacteria group bacterium]|nr:hypothetical protein [Patescibacteria group bacterium]
MDVPDPRPDQDPFEAITKASPEAIRLCEYVFASAADDLAEQNFRESKDLKRVVGEKTFHYEDDSSLTILFSAAKFKEADEEEGDASMRYIKYTVEITRQRPREDQAYWPESTGRWSSDDEDEADDDDRVFETTTSAEHGDVCQEVHRFYIDDEDYIPVSELIFQYIDDRGVILEEIDAFGAFSVREQQLSANEADDDSLHEFEEWLSRSFSQEEQVKIYSVLERLKINVA